MHSSNKKRREAKTLTFYMDRPDQAQNYQWYESFGKGSGVPLYIIHSLIQEHIKKTGWTPNVSNVSMEPEAKVNTPPAPVSTHRSPPKPAVDDDMSIRM